MWSNDPESCAGGSDATHMASRVRQVKGADPDKKGYPGPPGWGLGVRLPTSPRKKKLLQKKMKKKKKRPRPTEGCRANDYDYYYNSYTTTFFSCSDILYFSPP